MREYPNLVGGTSVPAASGATLPSVNPATGRAWARVPRSGAADAEAAVTAARAAFGSWSGLPAAARAHHLRKVAGVIAKNAAELAELETRDNGRTINETSRRDLPGMSYLWNNAAAECATAVQGRSVDFGAASQGLTRREPYGVTLGIIPWNSPISTFSAKAAFALAAGNTVIIKPAEQAAVSSLRLGELLADVLPPGVLNVVSGLGEEVGDPLVRSPEVDKVSLTGSVGTARAITRASAQALKPLALELGGKSPNIVFADADLDKAATGVTTQAIYTANAGQICYGGSRILVQRPVYDEMLHRMKEIAAGIRLGDPASTETAMGPIVSADQFAHVTSYLELGPKEGAELVFGGRHGADALPAGHDPELSEGYWVEPTLFAAADNSLRICQEEIFGPVAVVLPFDTEEEAVALANDSSYGLAAGVWTRDLGTAQRMFRNLHTGTVWVNTFRKVLFPLEGVKDSGYGHDSVLAYTREKAGIFEF